MTRIAFALLQKQARAETFRNTITITDWFLSASFVLSTLPLTKVCFSFLFLFFMLISALFLLEVILIKLIFNFQFFFYIKSLFIPSSISLLLIRILCGIFVFICYWFEFCFGFVFLIPSFFDLGIVLNFACWLVIFICFFF